MYLNSYPKSQTIHTINICTISPVNFSTRDTIFHEIEMYVPQQAIRGAIFGFDFVCLAYLVQYLRCAKFSPIYTVK